MKGLQYSRPRRKDNSCLVQNFDDLYELLPERYLIRTRPGGNWLAAARKNRNITLSRSFDGCECRVPPAQLEDTTIRLARARCDHTAKQALACLEQWQRIPATAWHALEFAAEKEIFLLPGTRETIIHVLGTECWCQSHSGPLQACHLYMEAVKDHRNNTRWQILKAPVEYVQDDIMQDHLILLHEAPPDTTLL